MAMVAPGIRPAPSTDLHSDIPDRLETIKSVAHSDSFDRASSGPVRANAITSPKVVMTAPHIAKKLNIHQICRMCGRVIQSSELIRYALVDGLDVRAYARPLGPGTNKGRAPSARGRANLACLMIAWKEPGSGEWIRSFAIITTDANELVAEIHDRMPLILAPGNYARGLSDEPDPRDLMRPFSAEPMRMWPISTRVNKPENDDPSIVEPIELSAA